MIYSIKDQDKILLDERVKTSRLLGSDENLVLHGGGNTSVKLRTVNKAGRESTSLFVKSSGSDLATIDVDGFTVLKLDDLLEAKHIEKMNDEEMDSYIRGCMIDHGQSFPSVEVFLHAFIESKFVDHSHADYIVAITNTDLSDDEIKKIFGGRVLVIPYVSPGFQLARFLLDIIDGKSLSKYDGIILRNHGLVTWGESSEESYNNHLKITREARKFVDGKWKGIKTRKIESEKFNSFLDFLPRLRGLLSRERKKILTWDYSSESIGYSLSEEAERFQELGPATPDMLVRTKRNYLYVDDPSELEKGIERFVMNYRRDFKKFGRSGMKMHDPYPCIIVVKGCGLVAASNSKRESNITRDDAVHSFRVASAANAISQNRFITDKQCFDMEYWTFQEAKLEKMKRPQLEGYIGLVTGAASGIGKYTYEKLAKEGVSVTGGDIDPKISDITLDVTAGTSYGIRFDISDEQSVKEALRETVKQFGGIDVVFNNAGYLKPSLLEETTLDNLKKHIQVNSIGTFLVTREAFRIMKDQGIGGTFVFNVTKNVTNPGEGMMAYGTSKAFASQLSRYVALEGGKYGIRSNVINPDKIFRESKIWEDGVLENRAKAKGISVDEYKRGNLLHIEVLPEHVANLVIELIKETTFGATTGTMIPIDGGIK